MRIKFNQRCIPAIGGALAAGITLAVAIPAQAVPMRATHSKIASGGQVFTQTTKEAMTLSIGGSTMVRLPRGAVDIFIANPEIADVQIRSPTALYLFGKKQGQTSFYATDANGAVIYSANLLVGENANQLDYLLKKAMPDASVHVEMLSGLVVLTGIVKSPSDIEEAERIVRGLLGTGSGQSAGGGAGSGGGSGSSFIASSAIAGGKEIVFVNRLKTATPLQVNLQVRIAEVSRDFLKNVGVNLLSQDASNGGFLFAIAQGREGAISKDLKSFTGNGIGTTLAMGGKLLGMDLRAALDLLETDGAASILAEPNLTALSGETASFLAGGEIPIPLAQALGSTSVEFKQYGVSLAFTPIVMDDGRISMRVRPEVSQLTSAGSVTLGTLTIPALITRRAETTVELGSGQSFAIAGLLQNNTNNSINKAPFLGDIPFLGALFRSNNYRRQETELVIVVTPYLVRPVNASAIRLPTDGYRAPTDGERLLEAQSFSGVSGPSGVTPRATLAPSAPTPPALSNSAKPAAAPGFSVN